MFLNTNGNNTSIEDFLKSMNFLAPNGQNLKYFIVPLNQDNQTIFNVASASGFEPLANENQVEGVTDNIVYARKDFKSRQSVSRPNFDPTAVPEEFPMTKEIDVPLSANEQSNGGTVGGMKTDVLIAGGQILPPGAGIKVVKPNSNIAPAHVGNLPKPVAQTEGTTSPIGVNQDKRLTVVESNERCLDFILNESIDIFPKNTLFHIVKD